ncbi:hypothetical protein Pmani_000623 [Petrolisthes manimaculis]|uniref:Uncharacterized protein n=1 Tax=Petrolisthes manimaculis TaxID=1843537 RepID=A0AAE1QPH2_9EUCA|nr:hypothetical protein Pmani_000623 [Petrolisthes manimaculis]
MGLGWRTGYLWPQGQRGLESTWALIGGIIAQAGFWLATWAGLPLAGRVPREPCGWLVGGPLNPGVGMMLLMPCSLILSLGLLTDFLAGGHLQLAGGVALVEYFYPGDELMAR